MSVGDIHWVEFPPAGGREQPGGREQQGRRPAIIMQDDGYGGGLPTTLVVPSSTAMRALRFAGTTSIAASSESGLRQESVALVFQFRAIDRDRIRERIGTISEAECRTLLDELRKLTGQND